MFCPKCQNQLSDTAKFCRYCGTTVASVNPAPATPTAPRPYAPVPPAPNRAPVMTPSGAPGPYGQPMPYAPAQPVQAAPVAARPMRFCPKCGKQLIPGAVFCGGCGTRLNQTPVAPQPAPMAPRPAPVVEPPVFKAPPVQEPAPFEPAPEVELAPFEPAPDEKPAPFEPAPFEPVPEVELAPFEPAPEEEPAPFEPAPFESALEEEPTTFEPALEEEPTAFAFAPVADPAVFEQAQVDEPTIFDPTPVETPAEYKDPVTQTSFPEAGGNAFPPFKAVLEDEPTTIEDPFFRDPLPSDPEDTAEPMGHSDNRPSFADEPTVRLSRQAVERGTAPAPNYGVPPRRETEPSYAPMPRYTPEPPARPETPAPAGRKYFCRNCGSACASSDMYCDRCKPMFPEEGRKQSSNGREKALLITAIILMSLILLVGGYFAVQFILNGG